MLDNQVENYFSMLSIGCKYFIPVFNCFFESYKDFSRLNVKDGFINRL